MIVLILYTPFAAADITGDAVIEYDIDDPVDACMEKKEKHQNCYGKKNNRSERVEFSYSGTEENEEFGDQSYFFDQKGAD